MHLNDGVMTFPVGTWWNGASGVPNSSWTARASLVHDFLCEMITDNEWPRAVQKAADREWYCIACEEGPDWYARTTYGAIRGYSTGKRVQIPFIGAIAKYGAGFLGGIMGLGWGPQTAFPCGEGGEFVFDGPLWW